MGLFYEVTSVGYLTAQGITSIGTVNAPIFDTGSVVSRVQMAGNSITAFGAGADVDINIVPKGAGAAVISKATISSGTLNSVNIGAVTPGIGNFVTSAIGSLTATNVYLNDLDVSNTLHIIWNENVGANKTLNLSLNGGNRNVTFAVDNNFDQALDLTANVNFNSVTTAGLTLGALNGLLKATAGIVSAGAATMDDIADGVTYGRVLLSELTSNKVTKLTDAGGSSLTVALSGANKVLTLVNNVTLDQNLQTTDVVTFDQVTVTTAFTSSVLATFNAATTFNSTSTFNNFATFVTRILGNKGTDAASANDMTLANNGNLFTVTGNVQINAITTTNWTSGSFFVLIFSGTPTVKHNTAGGAGTAPIFLSGSADFSAAANSILLFVYDGTQFQEIARKVA